MKNLIQTSYKKIAFKALKVLIRKTMNNFKTLFIFPENRYFAYCIDIASFDWVSAFYTNMFLNLRTNLLKIIKHDLNLPSTLYSKCLLQWKVH